MYPLTNFQQLAGLCNNEPFCKKTFSKYRLIAIILQKEQDSVLGHNLSNAFDRLQTTTGKNFAVISFVTPSKQWTRTHSAWAGMQENLFNCDDCDEQDFIDDLQVFPRMEWLSPDLPNMPAGKCTSDDGTQPELRSRFVPRSLYLRYFSVLKRRMNGGRTEGGRMKDYGRL